MIGFEYPGENLGIAATGAAGCHQVECGGMNDIGFRAHIATGEGRTFVAHQVIAGIHCFDRQRIGIVIGVQVSVDRRFYGSKQTILVKGFHLEIEQGGYEKTVEEHQEVQVPEGLP
jgi:hypothetical protein